MRWALAVLVAGCYSPHVQPGAPCSTTAPACPTGEVCIAGACATAGTAIPDAAIDAPPDAPSTDRDGDGISNDVDNCPDVANPDQGDEDGDMLGDVCDPCPPSSNNADDDGDGVANDCDPNPTTAGDHIALFEGFHHPLSAAWTLIGTWTVSNDSLVVAAADGVYLTAEYPAFGAHQTVAAGLRVISTTGTNYRIAGVYDNSTIANMTLSHATACGFFINAASDGSPNAQLIELYTPPGGTIDNSALAWTPGNELVVVENRHDNAYGCFGYNTSTSASASAGGTDAMNAGVTTAGLHVGGVTAHVRWFMIVTSP